MGKTRSYYTLVVREPGEDSSWGPQFGDYDRSVVAEELQDTKKDWPRGSKFRILTTDGHQCSINAAVAALNGGEAA